MTTSAIGRNCVVLGLAVCLVLSSLQRVSCQAAEISDFLTFENQEFQSDINISEELERQSITKESENESSWKQSTTISSSLSEETKTEAVSGQSSSMMDKINREIEAHLGDLNKQSGSDHVTTIGVSMDAFENDAERRKELEEIERQIKAAAATKIVVEEGTTKTKTSVETHETKFEGSESETFQTQYGRMGEKEHYEMLPTRNSIPIKGAWRCVNHDQNGDNEEEDASIIIPKYDMETIKKEESISQGSESQTPSLGQDLKDILDSYRGKTWPGGVITTETSSKEKTEIVEKLKVTLKSYRNIKIHELVTRSDFEEILTMAARYEELSSTSESYISRLSMYRSMIKEGIKASQRVKLAQQRARLLKDMAMEKQKKVDAEFALVKSLAQRGDALYVKIYAIKKLVMKLEAEKEEVDMNFQKIVGTLSRVLEEASQAYEEYHVVVRKWKEEKAAEEFSREAIESAEVVWVQFLSSL
ncbi:NAI2-like protein isoform X2 [Raphanus sativus]|uniref:NAI2-like protein isoform X2 n=1 Tax=Raphanus sativus TaxID=3726 RepID=A0A9W3CTF7_RAPSA|nr:NAI2-like protein isoform X2 [Raphanus sativus]XP_056857753.1 NAI2-like protein isoform X2 [Raphanus sativus]